MEQGHHSKEQLQSEILAKSHNKISFVAACAEWQIDSHTYSDEVTHCTCGMIIKEVFVIKNSITKNELQIGNVCISNFGDNNIVEEANHMHEVRSYQIRTGMETAATFMGYDKYKRPMFKIRRSSVIIKQLIYAHKLYNIAPPYEVKNMYRVSIKDKRQTVRELKVNQKYNIICRVDYYNYLGKSGYHLVLIDCFNYCGVLGSYSFNTLSTSSSIIVKALPE